VNLLVIQLGYLYLIVGMCRFVRHLVVLHMSQIQVLGSLNIHNFSIIGAQLLLVLLLDYELHLLGIIVVGMGLQ
jgi:hypothetical protein